MSSWGGRSKAAAMWKYGGGRHGDAGHVACSKLLGHLHLVSPHYFSLPPLSLFLYASPDISFCRKVLGWARFCSHPLYLSLQTESKKHENRIHPRGIAGIHNETFRASASYSSTYIVSHAPCTMSHTGVLLGRSVPWCQIECCAPKLPLIEPRH